MKMNKVVLMLLAGFMLACACSSEKASARSSPRHEMLTNLSAANSVTTAPAAVTDFVMADYNATVEVYEQDNVCNFPNSGKDFTYLGKAGKVRQMNLQVLKVNRCKNCK